LIGAIIKTANTWGRSEILPGGMIQIYNSAWVLRTEIINEQIIMRDVSWSLAWYLYGDSPWLIGLNAGISVWWNLTALWINWSSSTINGNETVSGTIFANWKFRLPVGTNLY
jgi:hypothetical protein